MPGCGKTVLSSTVIDHLTTMSNKPVLSFFFDFGDTSKQTKSDLLRSITFQLYQKGLDSKGHVDDLFQPHQDEDVKPTTRDLESLIDAVIASSEEVYIVLDALDESTSIGEVLAWIRKMSKVDHVQMIYTSREVAVLKDSIPELIGTQCCLSMDRSAIDSDIRSYVKWTLESDDRFTTKRLLSGLKDHLNEKVGDGAKGMFRWAACQLDTLSRCKDPRELERDLNMLPVDLAKTYERMLERIPQRFKSDTTRLLQFIMHARQPPNLQEAIEIIATHIDKDPPHFYTDCRLFNIAEILNHCTSLVSVVEVKVYRGVIQQIHLAHFSVKEYLSSQSDFHHVTASIAVTKTCLTYLSDIEGRDWDLKQNFPMAEYASKTWLELAPTAEASKDVSASIVKFLQTNEAFKRWRFLHACYTLRADSEIPWENLHDSPLDRSLYYACLGGLTVATRSILDQAGDVNTEGRNWSSILNAAIVSGNVEIMEMILNRSPDVDAVSGEKRVLPLALASARGVLVAVELLLQRNADVNAQGGEPVNALHAACAGGHKEIVKLLLENNADVHSRGGEYGNALVAAVSVGDVNIAQLLLDAGMDVNSEGGRLGNALQAASRNGGLDLIQLLLQAGAEINAQAGYHGTALAVASTLNRVEVVKLLLKHGADVTAQGGCYGDPLQGASYSGSEKVVEILLSLPVAFNEDGGEWLGSALQAACTSWEAQETIVRMLLKSGANANAQGGRYGNALLAACYHGHRSIIEILIEHGADVNTLHVSENHVKLLSMACGEGWERYTHFVKILADFGVHFKVPRDTLDALLESASFFGTVDVVKTLLELGANVNAQGFGAYKSALCAACAGHKYDVISLLLESGADINLGGDYSTALRCAASEGNDILVEMMLDLKADVNAQGPGSDNALLAASVKGHGNIVRILIDKGARTKTAGNDGWTPLAAAALNGHEEIVKMLIESGADTNHACKGGRLPLLTASSNGHIGVVNLLLGGGATSSTIDESGWTPLMAASIKGYGEVASRLLGECGVDPDHRHSKHGRTALSYAAEAGQQVVVELLLADLRVDPHSKDSIDRTPLSFASQAGYDAIVNVLLSRGAPVNQSDRYDSTPLSMAARKGHTKVVESLLAAGATIDSQDCFCRTPVWWARRRSHTEIVQLLLDAANHQGIGLGDEVVPEVDTKPHNPLYISCAICTFSIPVDNAYYSCPVCDSGDFDMCIKCFELGGRCLEESHELEFNGFEEWDESPSGED